MRRFLLLLAIAIPLLWLGGCSEHDHKQLRIAANPWVGFTPIVYAQQKGWLDELDIKFLWVVGLEESIKLYKQGLADGFVGTQYEFYSLKERQDLQPYFLFDRSSGADVILSNVSLETLHQSERIDAYLEITGLNKDLMQAFMAQYGMDCNKTLLHSSDPESLSLMKPGSDPSLLIAYEPYATLIEANGFKRLASTREITQMMVIDALWLNKVSAEEHRGELEAFAQILQRAIERLHADPREYYDTVKSYLKNQSYEEFRSSLEGIEWINRTPPPEVMSFLKREGIPLGALIP